jgi:hypothetical protein
MQLKDTKVSVEVEIMEGQGLHPSMDNLPDGQDVTVTMTGETGQSGVMAVVSGTVPSVITWLGTVYGMIDEDVLAEVPKFQLKDLIP